ncbi:protein DBF4 homolog A-like [Saccostrea echinata]|uniref:protein DBF4 homolog A-like n=1 Tax=Saccostrea echinata TaxID=191078 RepID=UPI002A83A21D|nr:protein DBF4 homolog A-like [Saccostrea echinata]
MKLNSNDGARRKLQFVPSSQTTYYLDISSDKVKAKAVQRILLLHGKIEEFLSKEVNLVLTDRNNIAKEEVPTSDVTQKQLLPFSRGKALLLKAAKRKSLPNDPVQNAHILGVDIQKVSKFLKDTECIHSKEKKSRNKAGMLDGIEPLTWAEKENYPVVKCEDMLKNYKPLIKNFDVFPHVKYDPELASPFDKTAMLLRKSKENVNRYAVQKQPLSISNRGGFCEACDHWYKCSLRQHLNSDRHLKFIKDTTNYKVLDEIMQKLPSLETFAKKFNLGEKTLYKNETKEEPGYQASVPEEGEDGTTEHGEVFHSCTVEDTVIKTTVSFYKENKTDCNHKHGCENKSEHLEDLPSRAMQNQEMKDKKKESDVLTSHKQEDNKDLEIPGIYFSPIHSPSCVSDNLSFADLANRWMADIKSACVTANKDSHSFLLDKNTKIQPSGPHQHTTDPICKPTSSVSDSKSMSSVDCDDNVLFQQSATVSSKDSASCLTSSSVNPVPNNVTDFSNNDPSHTANVNMEATKSNILNHVEKDIVELTTSKTPQPAVQAKVPVNRRLTYSPCVSKADNDADNPPLKDSMENKENQQNVYLKEQVQQPIKIKINLNSLKVNPNVHLVKSHRKRRRDSSLSNVYCAVQQSDMKLKLCKVKVTPVQQNGDLRHYWKVRKSGGCRLVFSAEKRKASEEGDYTASKRKRIEMQ